MEYASVWSATDISLAQPHPGRCADDVVGDLAFPSSRLIYETSRRLAALDTEQLHEREGVTVG
jgi:hypothetical protein